MSEIGKPVIYTALEFTNGEPGMVSYTTHHVAACNNKEAIAAIRAEAGIVGRVYINNIDAHKLGSPVNTLYKGVIEGELPAFEFERWLANGTRTHFEDGEKVPASWVKVPEALRAAS